jgi:hypothetical protein
LKMEDKCYKAIIEYNSDSESFLFDNFQEVKKVDGK